MNFTKRAMNTAILEAKILTDPVKRVQRKSKGNRNELDYWIDCED